MKIRVRLLNIVKTHQLIYECKITVVLIFLGVWIAVSPKGVGGLGDLLSGAGGAGSASKTIQTPKPALVTSVKVISPAPMPYQPPTAPNAYSPPISEGPTSELEGMIKKKI